MTIVVNGCTTPCMNDPYGFTLSSSGAVRRRCSHDCGPAYTRRAKLDDESGRIAAIEAPVVSRSVRGCARIATMLNAESGGVGITATTKYLFRRATQSMRAV